MGNDHYPQGACMRT